MPLSHRHSFLFNTLSVTSRANWRTKWGSHWHSPLQFFSALCPPYTLHQSLLSSAAPWWEERRAQNLPPLRLDVNWMAVCVSALPAKRFPSVNTLHSIAAETSYMNDSVKPALDKSSYSTSLQRYNVFVDFEKAFDRVLIWKLRWAFRKQMIPEKLVR